jgi:hypothetical protein
LKRSRIFKVFLSGISVFFIFSCSSSTIRPEPFCEILTDETDGIVNLRKEADFSAKAITRIPLKNKIIKKLGISNDEKWINLQYGNHTGWVNVSYVSCRYAPADAQSVVAESALHVMNAIKENNWAAVSKFVHPVKGVRFSPYAFASLETDQVYKSDELSQAIGNKDKRVWGVSDGSGDPILLSFDEYVERYIRKHNYWESIAVTYNQFADGETANNNIIEAYPHTIVVEYSLVGLDAAVHATIWSKLRLVFEKSNNTWFVVGIMHSSWTV